MVWETIRKWRERNNISVVPHTRLKELVAISSTVLQEEKPPSSRGKGAQFLYTNLDSLIIELQLFCSLSKKEGYSKRRKTGTKDYRFIYLLKLKYKGNSTGLIKLGITNDTKDRILTLDKSWEKVGVTFHLYKQSKY